MLILVKFFKKTLIFLDISENLDFVKLSKNVGLEILILVKIVEKPQIWSKLSKTLDFEQNCRKFSNWVKIYQKFDFDNNWRKCWI